MKKSPMNQKKNCIAKANENEERETDGHDDDDVDVINLFNAKNV